ncbi:hypothetical protein U3516DRAFT_854851 [Neocallimastix sp. 'constans']
MQPGEMQLGEMQHFNTTPLGEIQPGEMQFGEMQLSQKNYVEMLHIPNICLCII